MDWRVIIETIKAREKFNTMADLSLHIGLSSSSLYYYNKKGKYSDEVKKALMEYYPKYFEKNANNYDISSQEPNVVNDFQEDYQSNKLNNDPFYTGLKSLQTSINHLRQSGITFKEKIATLGGMKIIIDQIISDL